MPKKKEEKAPAQDEQFKQLEVSAKDPRTVALMLDSPESIIVCKACEALQKHMEKSEQNCIEMKELGVVQRLVRLLSSNEKAVSCYALVCLAVMSSHMPIKRVLLKIECIPVLLSLMKPEEELVTQERASYTVSQLAEEYTFKLQLNEQSAHRPLLQLVTSTDADVQKNCIKSLSLLTQQYQVRRAVAEEKGFAVILGLLESEYAEIQELTLHTLHNCLHDVQCRTAFTEAGGLSSITAFISNPEWNDLHVLAIAVLSLCLLAEGGMEALQSSDCLQRLLSAIKDSTLPSVKENAVTALARAAQNEVNRKILHEQNAEKLFIELLSSKDDKVLIAVAGAVSAMAALTSSKQLIGREGGVKSLVSLLQHSNGEVREASVTALAATLVEAQANCSIVGESGGVEHLVALLGEEVATCRYGAADCVLSMAPNGSLRSDLVEAGVMPALASCLGFPDTAVNCTAANALAVLGCDASSRAEFPDEGVAHLINMLNSSDTQLCLSAAQSLAVLAQSSSVADAVFKTRGARSLQKLSETSLNRAVAECAALALQAVLNGNLSAKYALTGCLTPQDHLVETEFFDAGMAESTDEFIPLSELMEKQLSMNKPVLTVSLLARPPPPPSVPVAEDPSPKEESQVDLQASHRGKSRASNTTGSSSSSAAGKGKKSKMEKHAEPVVTSEVAEKDSAQPQAESVLAADTGLWTHIEHTKTVIQPLPTTTEQVQQLAMYVCGQLGGALEQEGSFQYHLELAELQSNTSSNLIPLGSVKKGPYQHRALLFKILADHIGISSTLQRGSYGHYWNTVTLQASNQISSYLVDLAKQPGVLLAVGSHGAQLYQEA